MDDLTGRTAVVVGGGSGIGRGTSLGLGEAGMNVVVADIELEAAQHTVAEIVAAGGTATAERVDGTNRESLGELAAAAVGQFGSLHVLSNNVGIIVDRQLSVATEADWAWVIEFNFLSIVRSVDVFLPYLRSHGEPAHIVNTASMAALLALGPAAVSGVGLGLYTATKHAILGYTETLRGELAPDGIGVSVLCPGMVQSNLSETSARNRPERHGGPFESPHADRPAPPNQMPAEEVGAFVVEGIRSNRLHILTHPETKPGVLARQAALNADYDHFAAFVANR